EDGGVEENVLAPGQLRVKTRAHFDEARNPPAGEYTAGVGGHHPRDELEQGRFPRAVQAQDRDRLPLADEEIDTAQRLELARGLAAANPRDDGVLERERVVEGEGLSDALDDDAG